MPRSSPDAIDRREALRRAALVLGGVLSAPMVAGVLAGCEARRAPRNAGPRGRPRLPCPERADTRRVLHLGDWCHARAAARRRSRPLRGLRSPHPNRANVGGVKDAYDAIVVGSGITGGWAAKEL